MHFYSASLQSVGLHPFSVATDYYSILFLLYMPAMFQSVNGGWNIYWQRLFVSWLVTSV